MRFSFYKQINTMDCGPACLRMVAGFYGKSIKSEELRIAAQVSNLGTSLLAVSETAEKIGFRTRGVQVTYEKLQQAPLPAILHWNQDHFVVLVAIRRGAITIADPAKGVLRLSRKEFLQSWISHTNSISGDVGNALLLEPTPVFYERVAEKAQALDWSVATRYLRRSKWPIAQVLISLIIGSVLQLAFPFLMQTMVDTGINTRNMQYITIVLVAQLMLTLSAAVVGFIRNRLQLRISNSVSISILSDFWIKLTRLPIAYFDVHTTGDTIQRISDSRQLQYFFTGQALMTIFSTLNFTLYAVILALYSMPLFVVFVIGILLYFVWIRAFLPVRRKLNYETFHVSSKENNATLQLVQGMQEIRLNNAEQMKRWEWENLQARIFALNFKSLNFSQWQSAGALFINQGKDILISFMVAQLVVQGTLTFGAMLAIQYIIGQLNGPVQDFISLIQSVQDAKIGMERLNEVHGLADEEPSNSHLTSYLPDNRSISLRNVSFTYPVAGSDPVLKGIDLDIEEGKVTAIVGVSGSGKTTLLKLLLRIYEAYSGEMRVGQSDFRYISPSFWRKQCGAVMQDGYIFNDSIARNIALGEEYVDHDRLVRSCRMANVLSFIERLPNGFNTLLGADGMGISQGQRQRLLIARSLYKNPHYLFFDEATNALDANNEREIVEGLAHFFNGKTVVVVAHRLSTVRHADKIVVLHQGRIVEEGTHASLTALKGRYFELVKNQLELGV